MTEKIKNEIDDILQEEDRDAVRLASRREFIAKMAIAAAGLSIPLASCGSNKSSGDDDDNDNNDNDNNDDTSPDAGADSDSDGDTDSDTDSDSDSDSDTSVDKKSKVYVIKATDRLSGLEDLFSMVDLGFVKGKQVVLKPNFNSASASEPASTQDDTIRGVVQAIKAAGCGKIVLAESSGPSGTANVIAGKGTLNLCSELGIEFVNFDTLPQSDWENFNFSGIGWPGGLSIPKMMRSNNAVILLPCCKTHQYGGHFTLSLKLAVGLTPKSRRNEMHNTSNIRSWIADINYGFAPDLVVMDALKCFISGGPDTGTEKAPGLFLASSDRVAIDAVAVAVLLREGSNSMPQKKIFEQDQIARAVEIGLGASSPDEIEIIGNDKTIISELRSILDEG